MENTKLRESKYDLNMNLRHSKIQKLFHISNKFVSIIADTKKKGRGRLLRGGLLIGRLRYLEKRLMDGPMYKQTDGWTDPQIERRT